MKRRDFTKTTLSTAAALSAGLPLSRAVELHNPKEDTPPRVRKAVKLDMVAGDAPLSAKFALLAEIGFDGVEVSSPNQLDPDEVVAASEESGLPVHGTICSTHWALPLSHPDEDVRTRGMRGLRQSIVDCHRYGGDTVLVVPAVVNQQIAYDEAYRRSQESIRTMLPVAREHNVRLAFENVWNNFLLSPLEAAQYVDEFESEHVGWYFDVGNIVNYGWPEQWIRILGPRVLKLDVKAFSRAKRDAEGLWKGFAVEIGDGDVDWPTVMSALNEINFRGWATAEVTGGDESRLREIRQRMDRVLTQSSIVPGG